jgi:anaerobic magnesium-protoporphyrin IX monomethyl ester cyclase
MKILLINPAPIEPYSVDGPALGLCYLSSFLKERGIPEITGIDLNIDDPAVLPRHIDEADLVGVYCSTKTLSSAHRIAALAKARSKIVVFGGPHPSVLPEEILSDKNVDYVVLSEGEESFFDLIRAISYGGDLDKIDGFGYRKNGTPCIHPKTRYIKNLDTIPFPDRELFRFDYSKYVTICATRGCPYKCANCQPALSLQTCAFRMRSVENILAEIRAVGRNKNLHFVDNDLTVNRRWIRNLCEAMIAENLGIRWECQGRVNTMDADLMCLMKKAGCYAVGLGIESGSQDMLDGFLKKQIRLSKVKDLLAVAPGTGMRLHGWFILGIPTETRDDIEKTIKFALENEFASVGFSIGTPWPGTTFHKVSKEYGWILAENWDDFNEKRYSFLQTPDWGPGDISHYREYIVQQFRDKGWIVNEGDFMFGNPYWADGPLARSLKRPAYKMYFRIKNLLGYP